MVASHAATTSSEFSICLSEARQKSHEAEGEGQVNMCRLARLEIGERGVGAFIVSKRGVEQTFC